MFMNRGGTAFSFALALCVLCAGTAFGVPDKTMPMSVSTGPRTGTDPSPSVTPEQPVPSPEPQAETSVPEESAEPAKPEVPAKPSRPVRTYTVWLWQETGDSLAALAERFYGDPKLWTKIYEANKDQIADPRVLYPKQVLVIPYLDE